MEQEVADLPSNSGDDERIANLDRQLADAKLEVHEARLKLQELEEKWAKFEENSAKFDENPAKFDELQHYKESYRKISDAHKSLDAEMKKLRKSLADSTATIGRFEAERANLERKLAIGQKDRDQREEFLKRNMECLRQEFENVSKDYESKMAELTRVSQFFGDWIENHQGWALAGLVGRN